MSNDIIIIGAGGHAREIAYLIEEINIESPNWNIVGYIDKNIERIGELNGLYRIVGDEDFLYKNKNIRYAAIAVGAPNIVKDIHQRIRKTMTHMQFPNLVHPRVSTRGVTLGEGNIICEGTIFTTNIKMDSFNSINRGCNISHDCVVGSYCIINPGVNLSGHVRVADLCLLGTGATILQNISIGHHSIVGAGAVVTKDIEANMTVVGVPAKRINER